jgi:hypothetical protein
MQVRFSSKEGNSIILNGGQLENFGGDGLLMKWPGYLLLMLILMAARGMAQTAATPAAPPQASSQTAPPQPPDELAQMRDDLNKLDSLNLNMSSEIEFLRDQNLQILLRTNSQMWTVLIRDLRRQIEREEQRRSMVSPPPDHSSGAKPNH